MYLETESGPRSLGPQTATAFPYIALVAQHGKEVTRGTVQDGLYVKTPY